MVLELMILDERDQEISMMTIPCDVEVTAKCQVVEKENEEVLYEKI